MPRMSLRAPDARHAGGGDRRDRPTPRRTDAGVEADGEGTPASRSPCQSRLIPSWSAARSPIPEIRRPTPTSIRSMARRQGPAATAGCPQHPDHRDRARERQRASRTSPLSRWASWTSLVRRLREKPTAVALEQILSRPDSLTRVIAVTSGNREPGRRAGRAGALSASGGYLTASRSSRTGVDHDPQVGRRHDDPASYGHSRSGMLPDGQAAPGAARASSSSRTFWGDWDPAIDMPPVTPRSQSRSCCPTRRSFAVTTAGRGRRGRAERAGSIASQTKPEATASSKTCPSSPRSSAGGESTRKLTAQSWATGAAGLPRLIDHRCVVVRPRACFRRWAPPPAHGSRQAAFHERGPGGPPLGVSPSTGSQAAPVPPSTRLGFRLHVR